MGFYDWISDKVGSVYNTVKDAVGTIGNTVKNWSSGAYLVPGMNYCGPFNATDANYLKSHPPVNASDDACKQHDLDYDTFNNLRRTGMPDADVKRLVRDSDNRLINSLDQQQGYQAWLPKYGIKLKKGLEDWGILDPLRFVG